MREGISSDIAKSWNSLLIRRKVLTVRYIVLCALLFVGCALAQPPQRVGSKTNKPCALITFDSELREGISTYRM
jgi:hypothetical protein